MATLVPKPNKNKLKHHNLKALQQKIEENDKKIHL